MIRDTFPLFDCERRSRHLEKAYRMMWERKVRGDAPEMLQVRPIL